MAMTMCAAMNAKSLFILVSHTNIYYYKGYNTEIYPDMSGRR